jgi:hypothetical protein
VRTIDEQDENTAHSFDSGNLCCDDSSDLQNGRPAIHYGTVVSLLYKLNAMIFNLLERAFNYNYILTIAFVVVSPTPFLYMILQDWIPWQFKTASLFIGLFLFSHMRMSREGR